jgi:hypothetical protein
MNLSGRREMLRRLSIGRREMLRPPLRDST